MATSKLHISPDFFKHLSLEFQHLRLTIQLLETFVSRAIWRGEELGDNRLMLILDQAEVFVQSAKHLNNRLEKLVAMGVMQA